MSGQLEVILGAIATVVFIGVWLLNKYVTRSKQSAVVPKMLVK